MTSNYKALVASEELPNVQTLSYNVTTNTSQLILNQSVLGSIDYQDEQDVFTFNGSVGQVLYYDALQNNLSNNIRVRLVDPLGNTVFLDQEADSDYPGLIDVPEPQPLLTLTQTGTYQLIFESNSPESFTPGNYNFELIDVTSAPNISLNQVISDTLSPGGEANVYRFTDPPGKFLYLDSLTSSSPSGYWQLYDQNGQFVTAIDISSNLPLFIPDGTYTIVANGLSDTDINYSFQLISLTSELTLNTRITGTIDEPEKFFIYTFTGTAGQRLYYDALKNDQSDDISITLIRPSGETLFAQDADQDGILPPLTENGTYTLIIGNPLGSSDTGSYDFRLLTIEHNTVSLNTLVSGTLSPGQESDVYSFRGQAGQTLIFDSLTDGSPSASWRLYADDPFIPVAFGLNISTDFQATLLPFDYDYVLVIDGDSATDINYDFNIISINSTDIINGTSQRDNLIATDANNIIIGLQGSDVLTGGLGSDIFRYESNVDGGDRITDFTVGSDKIDLTGALYSLGYTGTDAIADGYVQFGSRGQQNSVVKIDPDGFNGSAKARDFIVVENVDVASLSNPDNFLSLSPFF
ncbi:M10 family metallopeptidase C-terminal domain-containing protein [Nostoc sp. MS1]|uniref:M10 family metallopeptidase C-terminal domain-containing protein n=1 Tax=Nostoc sp. MS1 TaxID=2764711 RepID=UPI001CC42F61|nr:type I secretion C-terminal target domain-containing protein [Nostoc sp. MS1]BCL34749.1 hypothetical protein NSMS1_11960 [Nostoc sp. MS1]